MLASLLDRLLGHKEDPDAPADHFVALAAGALLIEVAWADRDIAEGELQVIRAALERQFNLTADELDELVSKSTAEFESSVGLQAFTRTLVNAWDEQQRFDLLVHLWQLAYSDARIDRFEEHTIRKIAELLYVSHSRFIEAKRTARDQARN